MTRERVTELLETHDPRGSNALSWAASWSSVEVVSLLIDAGAEVNAVDARGSTALIYAALHQHNMSGAAVNLGVDSLSPENAGDIRFFAMFIKPDPIPAVLSALIDAGADVRARSKDGFTAWDLIQENDTIRDTDAYRRIRDAGLA